MPPPFSSTSLGTFVRRALRSAAQVVPRVGKRSSSLLQQSIHETFPGLRTPFYQLHPQPAFMPRHSKLGGNPLRNASRGFKTSYRPRVSGPFASNVGLGSARTYASGPTALNLNVPIGFRALAKLVNEDDDKLPKGSRFKPYNCKKRQRRLRSADNRQSTIDDYRYFFPRPAGNVSITLPTLPETLITPGLETTLSLPLSPSLQALLIPTTRITYDQAEIGISVLSRLTNGLYGVHELFSSYTSTRLLPLLAKLEGLGVLSDDQDVKVRLEVILDSEGRPDILRIIFEDRSSTDVMNLLGESLRSHEEDEWWALEQKAIPGLSSAERKEIMEVWESPNDLVMPTIDFSAPATIEDNQAENTSVFFDSGLSDISTPETYSWPEDMTTSQFSPRQYASPIISAEALSASLMSHLAESDVSSEAGGGSELWEMEIRPSEDDSDVESSTSTSSGQEWDRELDRAPSTEMDLAAGMGMRWAGSGEGFGFVQAW